MVGSLLPLATTLAMLLDEFARAGELIEVRVSWHVETLWFAPNERDAATLGREGVDRGRVWTATELIAVMALPSWTRAVIQTVAVAKLAIHGEVVEVGRRADSGTRPAGAGGGQN
jgi:hypothetical protein